MPWPRYNLHDRDNHPTIAPAIVNGRTRGYAAICWSGELPRTPSTLRGTSMKKTALSFRLIASIVLLLSSAGTAVAQNTSFGTGALSSITTGTNDSGFGTNAMQNTTTGSQDSAFGTNAMQADTTGSENSSFGFQALQNVNAGNRNTAVGSQALRFNQGND